MVALKNTEFWHYPTLHCHTISIEMKAFTAAMKVQFSLRNLVRSFVFCAFAFTTLAADNVAPLPEGVKAVWDFAKAYRETTHTTERNHRHDETASASASSGLQTHSTSSNAVGSSASIRAHKR